MSRTWATWALVLVLTAPAGVFSPPIRGAALTSVVPETLGGQADAAPKDKLADAFRRLCRNCHDPALELNRRTRMGWQDVLDQMSEKGATGTDEDFRLVLQYLLRDYGKVNVNQSASEELAPVLGISAEEARAVVAYREKNGRFKDFDALLKVSGVDATKLEAHRAAILY